MSKFYCCLFLAFFLLVGAPLPGRAAGQDDLARHCPQADKYRQQRTFYLATLKEVVRAPQTPQEVKARFADLNAPEKGRRQAAIIALALAGNRDLFHQLLAAGEGAELTTYAEHYLRPDGSLCLDPQIEKAIIRHFHDPGLSAAFLFFFETNLYSSQAFFKTLTPLSFEADNPDRYGRLVKALCATRLPGLEQELLALGRAALPHDTPAQKRLMPEVHQALIAYFASQQSPVFSYFRAVLAAEPRSEEVAYLQKSYGATRLAIYQALSRYEGEESFALFLEQLAELGRQPWGPFYNKDLSQLLSHLQAHPLFGEKQEQVIPLLAQILATPSLPGQPGFKTPLEKAGAPEIYDRQIRSQVYELLAAMDSEAAGRLLLAELAAKGRGATGDHDQRLAAALLQALVSVPASAALDVGRLLELAPHFDGQGQQLRLAEVVSRHPTPGGLAFVLEQFALALGDEKEGAASPGHLQAQAFLFEQLLHFSAPRYLLQIRAELDAWFVAGRLPEKRYQQMSSILSERLGQGLPASLAQIGARKEEKQRQELAASHIRWRQEMAAELQSQGSPEGIAANIQTLASFGPDAKKAGYWLMRVGEPVLPQVHAALAEPAAPAALKMQLMVVLAEIGNPSSSPFLLKAAASEPDNQELLIELFLALAKLPPTPEAITFVGSSLEKESSQKIKMSALAYFASHRHEDGLEWARKFATPENPSGLRCVALYLAAMLGEEEVQEQLVTMLAEHKNSGEEHLLLRGLAEITRPEEFQEILAALGVSESEDVEQISNYVMFRAGSGRQKTELAEKLLAAQPPFYSEQAVDFLLAGREFAVLDKYLRIKGEHEMSLEMVLYVSAVAQRIFIESRRRGFSLAERDGKIIFRKED